MPRACYSMPPISQQLLTAAMIDQFDVRDNSKARELMEDLVWSYITWWKLMWTFPTRKFLCTASIWEVRRAHANLNLYEFMNDCWFYLGRIPQRTEVMGAKGVEDESDRIIITVESLNELFDNPGLAWIPLQQKAAELSS